MSQWRSMTAMAMPPPAAMAQNERRRGRLIPGARRAAVTAAAKVMPTRMHMAIGRLPCSSAARSMPTATICKKPLANEKAVSRSTWTANRRHRKTTARQSATAAAA